MTEAIHTFIAELDAEIVAEAEARAQSCRCPPLYRPWIVGRWAISWALFGLGEFVDWIDMRTWLGSALYDWRLPIGRLGTVATEASKRVQDDGPGPWLDVAGCPGWWKEGPYGDLPNPGTKTWTLDDTIPF